MQNPPVKTDRRIRTNPPAGQPDDHAYAYDLAGNRRGEVLNDSATLLRRPTARSD
jgi:hypothetical protein